MPFGMGPLNNQLHIHLIYPYIVTIVGIYWVYPRLLGILFSSQKCQQKTPALLSLLELFSLRISIVWDMSNLNKYPEPSWPYQNQHHAVSFFEFPGTQKQCFGTHAIFGSVRDLSLSENLPTHDWCNTLDPGFPRPNEKPPMRLLNDNVSLVRTRGRVWQMPVDGKHVTGKTMGFFNDPDKVTIMKTTKI